MNAPQRGTSAGLPIRAGLAAVSQFERDHGAFTSDELAEADQWAAEAVERASRGAAWVRHALAQAARNAS